MNWAGRTAEILDALLTFIENQAHRRARLRVFYALIFFFLKIQKANVFLNSFILHRTGEILYAYTEPDIWFCRPPPGLAPINRMGRSPPNKNGPQNELHGRKHGPFGRNPPKQQDCKLEPCGYTAIVRSLSTLAHAAVSRWPQLGPGRRFLHQGGRAL